MIQQVFNYRLHCAIRFLITNILKRGNTINKNSLLPKTALSLRISTYREIGIFNFENEINGSPSHISGKQNNCVRRYTYK